MALLIPPAARWRNGAADRWTIRAGRTVWVLILGMSFVFRATRLCLLVALGFAFNTGPVAGAESPPPTMHQVQAAFLFNFAKFVTWPDDAFDRSGNSMVIGVLGEDPFGGALDQAIKDKAVHGRSFELKRFKQIGEMRGCHVLFVCASEAARLPEIFLAAQKGGILTVSDIDRFAERGGIINFYKENNKMRFKINLSAAERAGMKISSQLLRLGTIIREEIDAEK